MNTLRAKFILLLVVAIVSVVFLLTAVLLYLLGPPAARRSLDPIAQQVETIVSLKNQGATLPLVSKPAAGRDYDDATGRLREALSARGVDVPVTISRAKRGAPLTVSIPVAENQWFLMPIMNCRRAACRRGCC